MTQPTQYSLRELRARKGKTQKQVAADLGVTAATYCAWEKDLSPVAFFRVKALANYYNVSLDQISLTPAQEV